MVDLLIAGWDGASYNPLQKIQPPFYSSLEHGDKLLPEELYQGIPIDSGTAWTTITTGLEVEEHGFLSINNVVRSTRFLRYTKNIARHIGNKRLRTYFYYGLNKAFNLKDRTPRSYDVPYKRLWDYVDGRTLTLGVPLTYPAWKHDGVMFSGIPAPIQNPDEPDAYPKQYRKHREQYNGYYYVDGKGPLEHESQPQKQEYCDRCYELNEEAFSVVENLATDENFRVIFAVFPLIDDLLHALDPEKEREKIEEAYHWIDERTEALVDAIDPDEVLIISDHGMMPAEQSLNPHTYPGLKMDHDSMNGIWASDHDFSLSLQKDVTPAILDFLGQQFTVGSLDITLEQDDELASIDL